jgi:amino-acid N-acetyltransferase
MLRQARVTDVETIHALIAGYAEKGLMLPRSRARLYETVRDFVVAEEDGGLVATGALHTIWEDWGEICSLAVREDRQRMGFGTRLTESLLSQATLLGLRRVFVLTYAPGFFERFGFAPFPKAELPHRVWADCVNCPKFPDCGEVALVRPCGAKGA